MTLRWKIYFFLFSIIILGNAAAIFAKESMPYAYYHILIAFSSDYTYSYHLNIASALVNVITLVPLYLFVFRIQFLTPRVWQGLFIVRWIADSVGHSYEIKLLESFVRTDLVLAVSMIFLILVLVTPSYCACFMYAFRQKKLFASPLTVNNEKQ